jgi:hypothetical protein
MIYASKIEGKRDLRNKIRAETERALENNSIASS